jgi:predicted alpha-1,2-mannosidase
MNKKYFNSLLIFSVSILMLSCQNEKPADFVDPFIGTDFHGHTYPGATVPFGAVQLSPDTRRGNWDACSGYHYSDSVIFGFSHLHLSGTGAADLGDILFHPTTREVNLVPQGYIFDPLPFDHADETASPGYYKVQFKEQDITAEMTTTTRVGVHRYSFPDSESSKIIIDLFHNLMDETIHHLELNITGEDEITGARVSSGWTPNQHIYFVAKFSQPFNKTQLVSDGVIQEGETQLTGDNIQAILGFSTSENNPIEVNVGTSIVSIENARLNLNEEAASFGFDAYKENAENTWNDALQSIVIDGATKEQKRIFYTAMYHTMVVPNITNDVNGEFRTHNMEISKVPEGRKMYSTLSLWDTFRTWNPLMTLTNKDLVVDMIHSMLEMYDATGELPIWPLVSGETGTMIGYHSVSVIADAYLKGIRDFDAERALDAMKVSSMSHRKGGKYYVEDGFIPADREKESVSCLLEYAYDDWCIAQMAKEMGKTEDYETYSERAQSWIRVFDGDTQFFRGKRSDGNWVTPFNSFEASRHYTEANAWQYRFFVPHDVNGLVNMFGSEEQFLTALDDLFTVDSDIITDIPDITGLIGQYAHGNEPSHHKAFLYSYINQPHKTQEMIRKILEEQYSDMPDGIVGNEDCGQMSAWYIMSSLGLYPVSPGSGEYVFTSPLFEEATMQLHNGNEIKIISNNPDKNMYIEKVLLNDKELKTSFITHQQMMEGGVLEFVLTDDPVISEENERIPPYSMTHSKMVSKPYIPQDLFMFEESQEFVLGCSTPETNIYYTLDGSDPDESSNLFSGEPILVTQNTTIKARGYKNDFDPSPVMEIQAIRAEFRRPDKLSASKKGVNYKYYEGKFSTVDEMDSTPVIKSGTIDKPDISLATSEDSFGFEFTGLVYIEEDGIYDFFTDSDDGSVFYLGDEPIVFNDGSHGAILATGRVALKSGFHEFKLLYFEDYAGQQLDWGWQPADQSELVNAREDFLFLP